MARTEKVQNCLNPKFAKKFTIDYYFEIVQKLRFGIYDIDNKTIDLSDDDFLGELECTLGQVKYFSFSNPFPLHNLQCSIHSSTHHQYSYFIEAT